MKTNIYSTILGAVVIASLLTGCGGGESADKKAELDKLKKEQAEISQKIQKLEVELAKTNPDSTKVKSKEVGVQEVASRKFDHYVKTQGAVESEENIEVSSKSMGIITQVFAKEGEMVTKGQTLAQVDNSLVVRGIDELKSSLELANTVYDRQKNLWDQKIGTEVQYLQAKNTRENLERRLASLNEQNDMTRIKSPISGVVDEVSIKAGQNIAPGMPAVRVVNNKDLKIKANVSEAYSSSIKKGNKVFVFFPDIKKEMEAKVTFVGRNIDQLSRTFAVEINLPSNPDLRPNMTAVIKVVYDSYPTAIVVPVNVVQDLNGEKIIYVLDASGKNAVARKRVVTVDGVYDNLAQVKGLSIGEKIITVGYQGLSDGQFIKI